MSDERWRTRTSHVDRGMDSRTENISRRRSSSLFSAAVEKASTPTRAKFRSLKELLGLPFELMVVLAAYSTTDPNRYRNECQVDARGIVFGDMLGTHEFRGREDPVLFRMFRGTSSKILFFARTRFVQVRIFLKVLGVMTILAKAVWLACLLLLAGQQCRGADDGQGLEKFNLEMDWNPSSCFGDDQWEYPCDSSKIINAFTVSQMTAELVDRRKNNSRCWDISGDQAKKLVVSDEVSKETKAALECMFAAAVGSNEDLWRDVYVTEGSCSGMSPSQYFDTITRLYMSVGANQIASDFGLLSFNGTGNETEISVDRDSFLDYVTDRVGRKAWIECDPETRILRYVQVCIDPNDPYLIQDCTMDRNYPPSTNGIACSGELRLPIQPGGNISDKCSPYLLSEPKPALDGASSQIWGRSSLVIGAFVLVMAL